MLAMTVLAAPVSRTTIADASTPPGHESRFEPAPGDAAAPSSTWDVVSDLGGRGLAGIASVSEPFGQLDAPDEDLPNSVHDIAAKFGLQISAGEVEEFKQRIVDHWRVWFNPDAEWGDILPLIDGKTAGDVATIVATAITEEAPDNAWTVRTVGTGIDPVLDRVGQPIVLTSEQVQHAVQNLGMDFNSFARIVRISQATPLGASELAASEQAMLIAGVSKALGRKNLGSLNDQIKSDEAFDSRIAELEAFIESLPEGRDAGPYGSGVERSRVEAENELADLKRERFGPYGAGTAYSVSQADNSLGGQGLITNVAAITAARVTQNITRGLEIYRGDPVMASVYAYEPQLAHTITAAGFDPSKVSTDVLVESGRVFRAINGEGALGADEMRSETLRFLSEAYEYSRAVTA